MDDDNFKSRKDRIIKVKNKKELHDLIKKIVEKNPNADLNDIDVSNIDDLSNLFSYLNIENIDISRWNVSNVKNMKNMFFGCDKFNCDLSNWDVRNVEDASYMFCDCNNFEGKGLHNWKFKNLDTISFMFWHCNNFKENIDNWKINNKKIDTLMAFSRTATNVPTWYKS